MVALADVFGVHRFIAGGFGLSLLLAPDAVNNAFDASRQLPVEEKVTLQSWACFMIIVALVVHSARGFPDEAQRSVGQALLAGMVLINILYGLTLLRLESGGYKTGVAATGSVFFGLMLAYGFALRSSATRRMKVGRLNAERHG
eukprot:TRINITY_DN15780_c2_g1_i1.p1 TRINITY_DN15780_c2_g1~~TRINITY_DN15780_c2_g1_i1.p1  ORF type:complete len:144 (-),score=20.04 TRINITY_DN15780_c2_g1_i1:95-526(-)